MWTPGLPSAAMLRLQLLAAALLLGSGLCTALGEDLAAAHAPDAHFTHDNDVYSDEDLASYDGAYFTDENDELQLDDGENIDGKYGDGDEEEPFFLDDEDGDYFTDDVDEDETSREDALGLPDGLEIMSLVKTDDDEGQSLLAGEGEELPPHDFLLTSGGKETSSSQEEGRDERDAIPPEGAGGPRTAALRSGGLGPPYGDLYGGAGRPPAGGGTSCAVCSSNRNECRIVSGIFTRTPLPYGYNSVTTVPVGACNISVVESRPSKNFFALRRPDGPYELNGDWNIEAEGRYNIAGTVFRYTPAKGNTGEKLYAPGPLNAPLELMLIYQSPNSGIQYEYRLPIVDPPLAQQPPYPGYPRLPSPAEGPLLGSVKPVKIPIAAPRPAPEAGPFPQRVPSYLPSPAPGVGTNIGGRLFVDPVPLYPNGTAAHRPRHHHSLSPVGERWPPTSRVAAQEAANATLVLGASEGLPGRRRKKLRQDAAQAGRRRSRHRWVGKGFSECSKSCGGGNQTLVLACERKRRRNKAVDSKFCAGLPPPTGAVVQPCNLQPCPAKWVAEAWGPCSASCGIGTQTREVLCKQEVTSTYIMVVPAGACLDPPMLPKTQSCQVALCPGGEGSQPSVDSPAGGGGGGGGSPVWEVDPWDPCSSECGVGTRSRKVRCVRDGVSVPESFCFAAVGSRPATQELCDPGSCTPTAWLFSEWDKTCSAECGGGVVQRKVVCSADGSVSAEAKCDALHRPAETQPCSAPSECHPQWFRGQWGLCRGECGVGRKTRPVVCVVEDSPGRWRVVADSSCVSGRKPSSDRNCQLPPCKPRWFISTWSQCSASCGGGVKRRQAKCMSPSLQLSAECPALTKPATRQPCNLHSCGVPQTVIANVRLPDGSALLPSQNNEIDGLPKGSSGFSNVAAGTRSNSSVVPSFEATNERPAIVPGRADTSGSAPSSSGRLPNFDPTDHRKRPMVIALGDDSSAPNVEDSSQGADETKTGCVDRMKNCHLVFRARLCRLRYYNKLCCKTCQRSSTVT